jgi:hypothetical protein
LQCDSRLEPLGRHALRGVREPKEIFALDVRGGQSSPSLAQDCSAPAREP